MYIVRANQAVMIALNPSIPISTARLSSKSFNDGISPARSSYTLLKKFAYVLTFRAFVGKHRLRDDTNR